MNFDIDQWQEEIEIKRISDFVDQLQKKGGKLKHAWKDRVEVDLTEQPLPEKYAELEGERKQRAEQIWLEGLELGMNPRQARRNVRLQLLADDVNALKTIERMMRPDTLDASQREMMTQIGDSGHLQSHLVEKYMSMLHNNYDYTGLLLHIAQRVLNSEPGQSAQIAHEMSKTFNSFKQAVFDKAQHDAKTGVGDMYVDRGHVVELDDLFVGSEEAYEIDLDTQALKEWNFGQRKEFEITGDILSARTELQKNAEAVQKVEAEREAVAEKKFTIRRPQKKSALAHMENARNPAIVVDRSGHSHVILDGAVYSTEPIDNPEKEHDIWDDPVMQEFKKELLRLYPDGPLSQEVPSHATSEFVQKQADSTVRQRADILPRMEAMQNIANDPAVRQESSRFKQSKDNITKAGLKVKEFRK